MSTYKSLMAPKRASKRFSVTREEMQIDPSSVNCLRAVRVYPIACNVSGRTKYRLAVENSTDNICGLEDLEDDLRTAGLTLRLSAVDGILETLQEVAARYIA